MQSTARQIGCLLALSTLAVGCHHFEPAVAPDAPATPIQTYKGPTFFHTSIGSMATIRGYQPTLVSGYGLVVNLENTGSAECPPALREWMLNEMGKQGFGRISLGAGGMRPEQVLASNRTAVVLIQGVIPPGATVGTRFDLLVSTLPGTQTTSLQDGLLYTTDLYRGLLNLSPPTGLPNARGKGPVTLNPAPEGEGEKPERLRIGKIIAGGVVTQAMALAMEVTQPSYRRTRDIANRINTRFPPSPDDRFPAANAQDDSSIEISIPDRFAKNPQRLIDLIEGLYLNATPGFSQAKARELARVLEKPENRQYADRIAHAWEGMGNVIRPILRELYAHENPIVRLAALQAGSRMIDATTAEPLYAIASTTTGNTLAAELLGDLLRSRPDHGRARLLLRKLLDHDDSRIRIAAYEALADVKDSTVQRWAFPDKMELAKVTCERPMIWAAQSGRPRIVIFNDALKLEQPTLFTIWNNRLMIKVDEKEPVVSVYYKPLDDRKPTIEKIDNDATLLAGLMAYKPDKDAESNGLDLSYSRIVSALEQMSRQRHIAAPFVLQDSDLTQQIEYVIKLSESAESRPEENEKPAETPNPGADRREE